MEQLSPFLKPASGNPRARLALQQASAPDAQIDKRLLVLASGGFREG